MSSAININGGNNHKFANATVRDKEDFYEVDVNGKLRADEVYVPINGNYESLGLVIEALVNSLVANGVIKEGEFEDNLDALKVVKELIK